MEMRYLVSRLTAILLAGCLAGPAFAQKAYSWQELRDKFEASNRQLQAGQIGIDESKTQEVTAFLRPNPDLTFLFDQFAPFQANPYRPLGAALPAISSSYL